MSIIAIGLINPVLQFVDANGVPYAGGTLRTEAAGGSGTALPTYSDAALTVQNSPNITLDLAGRCVVYMDQLAYKFILKNAAGTTVWSQDNIQGSVWPGAINAFSVSSPAVGANGYGHQFNATINKQGSGTHALFAANYFPAPSIGAGGATLTESSTVYIADAPAAGTNKYALHVASGAAKFDGAVSFTGTATFTGAVSGVGTMAPAYIAKAVSYGAAANDFVSCTAGGITITLPAAASNLNKVIFVVNNSSGTITIARTGADTIGLATSQTLNPAAGGVQGDSMVFLSDGVSNWSIV